MRGRAGFASMAVLLTTAILAAGAQARDRYDVKLLAHVPPPGYPALSYVAPDRTIYVSTFIGPNSTDAPAAVFSYKPDGTFLNSYTISGETGSQNGVQVAAMDARGLLYLLDQHPPRIVTLNPVTREQRTYATFKDVPPCVPPDSGGDCSDTVMDNEPEPDYAAWGPDGSLYVTDYIQGLIWRVPPGGGEAHVWFTSTQLDGTQFGPAGIVLMPDLHTLMISTSAGPVLGGTPSTGKLYTLPIQPDGKPGKLTQLWESGQAEGPDGFALGRSGNVYLALVGPNVNQLVVISPQGKELARISHAGSGDGDVPFDSPSSVQFDGDRMIVTNDAYFSGDVTHFAIFDVFAGEQGQPIYVPPASKTAPAASPVPTLGAPRAAFRLRARPSHLRAGRTTRVRFSATVSSAGARASAFRRGRIRVAGRTVRLGRRGRASLRLRPSRAGTYTARLLPAHGRRTLARATLRVTR